LVEVQDFDWGAERRMTPAQEHVSTAWFIDLPLVDTGSR
jgi:hypothetical protein